MKGLPRLVFLFALLWGLLLIWLAPRPLLLDVPQHAAQIALMQDLLAGHSRWAQEVEIRWATPYLAAYSFMLLFATFSSIVTATKLTLSLGYLATFGMAVLLRRRWRAPVELDWLLFIGYFSFNYDLGFITLVLAAPFAMLSLWLSDRQREDPSLGRTAFASLAALLTLVAHPLMWLFANASNALALLLEFRRWRQYTGLQRLQLLLPMALSGALAGFIFLWLRQAHVDQSLQLPLVNGSYEWSRLSGLLFLPLGYAPFVSTGAAIVALLISAFLISARGPNLFAAQSAPLWVTFVWFVFGPGQLLTAAAIHARVLVLFFPSWVWAFGQRQNAGSESVGPSTKISAQGNSWRSRVGLLLAIGAVLATLAERTANTLPLIAESASFDPILARMEPGKRVLYLQVPYPDEALPMSTQAFRHFGLWYQAEKHGLVDFNFAWGNQMIVRFRPGQVPRVLNDVNRDIRFFNWQAADADRYEYFLIHLGQPITNLASLFRSAPCQPRILAANAHWILLVPGNCPARRQP